MRHRTGFGEGSKLTGLGYRGNCEPRGASRELTFNRRPAVDTTKGDTWDTWRATVALLSSHSSSEERTAAEMWAGSTAVSPGGRASNDGDDVGCH